MGKYRNRTTSSQTSTTGEPAELQLYSPVAKRVQQAVNYMVNLGGQSQHSRSIRIMGKLMAAAIDDFAEIPPEISAFYMSQLALVVEWCASGQWKSETIPVPEGFSDIL